MPMFVCMYRMVEGEPVKPLIVYASDRNDAYVRAKELIIEKEGREPFYLKVV